MSEDNKTIELKDEELKETSDGTIIETLNDYKEFINLGLVTDDDGFSPSVVKNAFKEYGIKLEDYGGLKNNNRYFLEA